MIRNIFLFGFFMSLQVLMTAQVTSNSPYSRFGIGDLVNPNYMTTSGMGNTGSAYISTHSFNPLNPASYSFLTLATYEIGVNAEYSRVKDNKVSENKWSGNLDYIGLAFPLRNYKNEILDPKKRKYKFGMGIFLKPFSSVNYDVTTHEEIADSTTISRRFIGNGGTYNLGWGNSVKYKNISFGANIGLLLGNIKNTQVVGIVDDLSSLEEIVENKYNLKGFKYDLGFIYKHVLNKEATEKNKTIRQKSVTVGMHGSFGTSFLSKGTYSHIGQSIGTGLRDTISYNPEITGTGWIPGNIGFGINYYDGRKFNIGLDVEYSVWKSYENTVRPKQDLRNTLKVGLGGQYTPDERGFGSFLERVNYKYGMYFNQDPRIIDSKQLNSYGVTFGMGLPFFYQQKFSKINVNFNIGQRGAGTLISETYIQTGVGFSFNDDSWFVKRKYN